MNKTIKILLHTMILTYASSLQAQDKVCFGSSSDTYSVDKNENNGSGTTGSTYVWNIDETAFTGTINNNNANEIDIDWGSTPVGTYTLNVIETNSNCTGSKQSMTIEILARPTINFTNNTSSICQNENTTITVTTDPPNGNYSYSWSVPTGVNPPGNVSSFSASTAGDYSVVVTNTDLSCSSNSETKTLTVQNLPTAVIHADDSTTICEGENVELKANTGIGFSYQWYDSNGIIPGETNTNYTATTASNFYVIVTNNNGCSKQSNSITVTINQLPTASITNTTSPIFCEGENVELVASTNSGTSYQWYDSNGLISGETNANLTASKASDYYVIVTNANGCKKQSNTVTVTVNALPQATIMTSATNLCQGSNAILSANTDTGTSYQWYDSTGLITGATNANYSASHTSSYYVVISNATCSKPSNTISITVNPIPITSPINHN